VDDVDCLAHGNVAGALHTADGRDMFEQMEKKSG